MEEDYNEGYEPPGISIILVNKFSQIEMEDVSNPIKTMFFGLHNFLQSKSTENIITIGVNEFTD